MTTEAVSLVSNEKSFDKWNGLCSETTGLAWWLYQYMKEHQEAIDTLNALTNFRNDMNHCGCREGMSKPDTLQNKLGELIEKIDAIMTSHSERQ